MKVKRELVPSYAFIAFLVGLMVFGTPRAATSQSPDRTLRVAYFPILTQAPAFVGLAGGIWQKDLPGYGIDQKVVHDGPEAMEALVANEIDFAFLGPSPAINTYIKSGGKALRVISGVCLGGASLIRRADVSLSGVRDLDGKRVAVPQLGGTQDLSCRHFLAQNGLQTRERGGTVEVVPIKVADVLGLFLNKQVDAAWIPEPWVARIKADTGAQTVFDERDLWPDRKFCTIVLVVRSAYADAHPDVVDRVLQAHRETLSWMQSHESDAKTVANSELKRLTGKALAPRVLDEAWSHVNFTSDPDASSIKKFSQWAILDGYQKAPSFGLSGFFDGRTR